LARGLLVSLLTLCLTIVAFSSSKSEAAFRTYQEALNAYNAGEFKRAELLFEYVLQTYPKIESEIPALKLYLGVSAYHAGDYAKAKTYLRLFPNSPLARELLNRINELEKKGGYGLPDWSEYTKGLPTKSATSATRTKEVASPSSNRLLIIALLSPLIAIGGFLLVSFFFARMGLLRVKPSERRPVTVAAGKEELAEKSDEAVIPELANSPEMGNEVVEAEGIEEIEVEEILQEELEDVRSLLEGVITEEEVESNQHEEQEKGVADDAEETSEETESLEPEVFSQATEALKQRLKEVEHMSSEADQEYIPIEALEQKKPFSKLVEELENKEELEDEEIQALMEAAARYMKELSNDGGGE